MSNSDFSNIEFVDLIDIETIQQFQDSFSDATGVASVITKPDGTPITKPSNFCNLCKMIRKTEIGLKNCYSSDAVLGRQYKGGPIYQKCLSGGLWDGGASISVGDKHIANWLIGQVFNEESDEKKILAYAKEIGADEFEFRKELNKVTRMPLERFKKIVNSLYIYANQLSEKAYQNFQLKMHQEHLELLVKKKTEDLEDANEELRVINDDLSKKNHIIQEQNDDLKKALKQLKETQSQLLQADKMASLGTLTAGVAHEINNPLNYIMGAFVGLENYFKKYGSMDEQKTSLLLHGIEVGVARATGIVRGLNDFSRDNSRLDEDCDIHKILDNCLLIVSNRTKHVIKINKVYTDKRIVIKGNVGKLHQVFINILTNSLQAIKEKGEITIRTEKNDAGISIVISDNGCGISKENLKQITDPFFTTKQPGEGTGLGLSITYSIIKDHKGSINFDSELGKGTRVTIVFQTK